MPAAPCLSPQGSKHSIPGNGLGKERRKFRSLTQTACTAVCVSANQKKIVPHRPVLGTTLGTGDATRAGQTQTLLTVLPPPPRSQFPLLEMKTLLRAPIPFFLVLCSIYQPLISHFNHSPNPPKTGPIFQKQNQRSLDDKTELKTQSF